MRVKKVFGLLLVGLLLIHSSSKQWHRSQLPIQSLLNTERVYWEKYLTFMPPSQNVLSAKVRTTAVEIYAVELNLNTNYCDCIACVFIFCRRRSYFYCW